MKILLHACCGPCSLEPVRILAGEGAQVSIAYCNPNIQPEDEYRRRLATLEGWASGEGIEVLECDYDPGTWERCVGIYGTARAARCRACYRMRFERVARMAADGGFDCVGTTLSVSPYQFTDVIAAELGLAAARHGVGAYIRDFRPQYPEATRRSRELGMYRQNYCGCRFSYEEAAAARRERGAVRRGAKAAARIACAMEGAAAREGDVR